MRSPGGCGAARADSAKAAVIAVSLFARVNGALLRIVMAARMLYGMRGNTFSDRGRHHEAQSVGSLEGWSEGRQGHDLDRKRRSFGYAIRIQIAFRKRTGHESGRTYRGSPCGLLLHGAVVAVGRSQTGCGEHQNHGLGVAGHDRW